MSSVPALPYSLGAKRFTPAAMQAVMRFFWASWWGSDRGWMKERRVWVLVRAVVKVGMEV
jgi:hypothetical protein